MKPLFTCIMLLALWTSAYADIIRVNNTGADADYSNLQTAVDAASAGDTLHIEPSGTSYGNLTLNKSLTLIGPGYHLDENIDLQASPVTSAITNLSLAQGCDDSVITGLDINAVYRSGSGSIADVVFTRNRLNLVSISGTMNISNLFFSQNYFYSTSTYAINISASTSYAISFTAVNNIFYSASTSYGYIAVGSNSTGIFINNNFDSSSVATQNSTFENNIFSKGSVTNDGNSVYTKNVCHNATIPASNGNILNVTPTSVYEDHPNTSSSFTIDSRYQLKSGSPAIGAGVAGVDCGAFGGSSPYRLSGIPAIPSIYFFNSPSVVSGNFNVTISTRSNN